MTLFTRLLALAAVAFTMTACENWNEPKKDKEDMKEEMPPVPSKGEAPKEEKPASDK